jgi:hypothetical protein
MLRMAWTFLAVMSSLPVWGETLGSAAWNGMNWIVCLYLIVSTGGSVGLLAGFCSAFSPRRIFKWITFVAALAVLSLSAIYAFGFIFRRTPGIPLGDPMYFTIFVGTFHAPILLLYAVAIFSCLVEALLYVPGPREPEVR